MNKKQTIIFGGVVTAWLIGLLVYYLHRANIQILNPRGPVAQDERDLIIFTTIIGLFVVLPVYVMTFTIAWKYRESNKKAKYRPDWDHSPALETLWWGIPTAVILGLSITAWVTSHSLDPHRPVSNKAALHVQVIALDWKWLFIYPQQRIASVNYVQFPVNKPITFDITSDGPMNSFWIPQLGSQIYAMAGMSTHLNLMASTPGEYAGSSANISGRGFSGMRFAARASSEAQFNNWAKNVRRDSPELTAASYRFLAKPSENNPRAQYKLATPNLFNNLITGFQVPAARNR